MPVPAAPSDDASDEERAGYLALCREHLAECDLPTLVEQFPDDHIPDNLRGAWERLRPGPEARRGRPVSDPEEE